MLVVMLVVVLLCRHYCWHPAAAATAATLLVGKQDDACYTNAKSSPDVGMVLPSPTRGGATATRVVGE